MLVRVWVSVSDIEIAALRFPYHWGDGMGEGVGGGISLQRL